MVGEKGRISSDALMVVARALIDMNVTLLFLFVHAASSILMIYFSFCIFLAAG